MSNVSICLAQINTLVGDIPGNTQKVLRVAKAALQNASADLVLFPELTLTGYPPEDLLLRPSLQVRIEKALQVLCDARLPVMLIVGYPRVVSDSVFNMAGVIHQGGIIAEYAKQQLPNYQVFDEKRYFVAGKKPCVFDFKGIPTAITICEDIWQPEPVLQAKNAGAKLLLNLNASPFRQGKSQEREALLATRSQESGMPIVYTNAIGGQDELIFDGGSLAVNAQGEVCLQAPFFCESQSALVVTHENSVVQIEKQSLPSPLPLIEQVYQALVLSLKDYVEKNGFKGVVLGLSGGIDSALTLAIAVEALGCDKVEAVMMPFRYTSELSKTDAATQAKRMGVRYQSLSIEPMYNAFMTTLAEEFTGMPVDTTEENLQARCRGVLLMAISNKKGSMVLTTGNKSEMAVGYSTLYGDMAGGFDVLKDVPKMQVFELARFCNSHGKEVIPESVITRPPSAELAPDQKDEDSLPPYPVLDEILEHYIEQDCSAEDIIAAGFKREDVERIIRLVDINEYKRRQAPIGPRLTGRGFGRDRRYPITSGWKLGE